MVFLLVSGVCKEKTHLKVLVLPVFTRAYAGSSLALSSHHAGPGGLREHPCF